jgi:Retrotransposon gag protein
MVNAYARTALILTFIKGENINNWVSHQLDLLIKRIKNRIKHSDKAHWDLFEADFMTAFVNSGSQQTAYTQLEKLSMGMDNLDQYISTFNRLLKQAGFQARDLGSVERFKKGLQKRLQITCLKQKPEPITMAEWQKAAKEENLIYLKSNPKYTPFFQKPTQQQYKVFQHWGGPPTRYWKPKGPNAMNVDTTQTTDPCSQGKWEKRKDTYKCFFCKKQGHIKKDCYAFQHTVKEGTARPFQDKPTLNRVTEIVDDRTEANASLTPEQFTQML